ncbi:chemotaxis protein CheB [Virgisporangium aliadipatigenens]|uniref:protein-glutamate methylesterase n=1 Tax=Virgisporangium aliadipatigenens TaxID=741659 RepID=A0A8J4DPP8_9ACTN|nr:chemotaxis protein CheB [Virgisporangium aliadipatigenens]
MVIGGSAGSHAALQALVAGLPADLAATVLVTVHLAPEGGSTIAAMLDRIGGLPAVPAVDGERARPAHIHTAVPDRHLLITADDTLRLGRGPRQNLVRPAVDATFRTAARWCGPRVIGVVLSGSLDDGASGLASIVEHGGVALVQRPDDAKFAGMPSAALKVVPEATALPADDLGRAITALVGRDGPRPPTELRDSLLWETDMLAYGHSANDRPGEPVALGCPECGGGMYRFRTGFADHYVCHVGHSFSPQALLSARSENVEAALWTAISALQEQATVLRQMARYAGDRGDDDERRRHEKEAQSARHAGEVLRRHLTGGS